MVLLLRREWCAWCLGALAALVLARWSPLVSATMPVLGALWLARTLGAAAVLWLAPVLPRRVLPAVRRRAVLVTGCDSGFGHEVALRFDALGVPVFAGVLAPDGPGAALLRGAASSRMRVLPLDVTDDASVAAAADVVARLVEASDCELWAVVNNAGILKLGECEWLNMNDVKQSLEVNALGQIRVTKEFLPLLRKSEGRVVNVISLAARVVLAAATPYTMSKFASLAFSESLRCDLSKFSISVHNIEPWIYHTNLIESVFSTIEKNLQEIPDTLKNVYSDKYKQKLEKTIKLIIQLTALEKSNIYQVVDAIEDACFAEDPMKRYLPGQHSKIIEIISTLVHHFQPPVLQLIFRSKSLS